MPLFIDINSLNHTIAVSGIICKCKPKTRLRCSRYKLRISSTNQKDYFWNITVSTKEPIVYVTHGILVNNFSIINTGRVLPFGLIFQVHIFSISDKLFKRQKIINPVLIMHVSIVNFRFLHIVVQLFCDISAQNIKIVCSFRIYFQ